LWFAAGPLSLSQAAVGAGGSFDGGQNLSANLSSILLKTPVFNEIRGNFAGSFHQAGCPSED
jgi:hypothetical protein